MIFRNADWVVIFPYFGATWFIFWVFLLLSFSLVWKLISNWVIFCLFMWFSVLWSIFRLFCYLCYPFCLWVILDFQLLCLFYHLSYHWVFVMLFRGICYLWWLSRWICCLFWVILWRVWRFYQRLSEGVCTFFVLSFGLRFGLGLFGVDFLGRHRFIL